jgi:hypothetical protein
MDVMPPKHRILIPLGLLLCAASILAVSRQNTASDHDDFPYSAWRTQKEVTQIPWSFNVGKTVVRSDLRRELQMGAWFRSENPDYDWKLFARVLEKGKAITPLFTVTRPEPNPEFAGLQKSPLLSVKAIVRPGKYRVELAYLDRTTGKYNTKFEDVTVDGNENEPLERAFQTFPKFEFVQPKPPEKRPSESPPAGVFVSLPRPPVFGQPMPMPVRLTASNPGDATDQPSFVIEGPGTTHLSIVTILSRPDLVAARDERFREPFKENLSSLLSVFVRLRVPRGTARLTGVDLTEGTRVFDQVGLSEVTPQMLTNSIGNDPKTVSLDNLSRESDRGRLFRDVLSERLEEATRDTSGARHTIIVVTARNAFPNSDSLTLPAIRDCHCKVFYLRFAMLPNETDDIDNMLKAYRPRIYEPLSWTEFRRDFEKIYAELQK